VFNGIVNVICFLPAADNKCCGYLLQAAGRRLQRAATGYHFCWKARSDTVILDGGPGPGDASRDGGPIALEGLAHLDADNIALGGFRPAHQSRANACVVIAVTMSSISNVVVNLIIADPSSLRVFL